METDEPTVETDGNLETVRVLHQTVVSLRSALEKSKAELHQLREQVKQRQEHDLDPYERTIESLSLENHVLRGRVIADQQSDPDQQLKANVDQRIGDKMNGDEDESRHDGDNDSDVDDVFEVDDDVKLNGINAKKESSKETKDDQQGSRFSKGSEDDSEEVDDIELIFMTDDTKDELNMSEDLVPIIDDHCGKFVKKEGRSVLVETDISKCGVIDENESPVQPPAPQQQMRRNTAPLLAPLMTSCKAPDVASYKPIAHRELVDSGASRVKFNVAEQRSPVRPVLVDRRNVTSDRQESETQTDITALPVQWRSESFLAQDRAVAMATTLPSKFQVEGSRAHQLRKQSLKLCERTQEARRVLLSDINFTSMVPELSRSADHLCSGGAVSGVTSAALLPTSAALLSKYPRALAYMKNPDLPCGGWSPCDCARRPSWDYGTCGSTASMAVSASSELGFHGDCPGRRRHSMRPSLSSLDASSWASPPHHLAHQQYHQQHQQQPHHHQHNAHRPLWASVPSSPTHANRINPPMTEYFTIEPPWLGQVQSSILPKETIRMRVVLKRAPLEPRPHYDSMQITNSNDCQIHVTLEALPRFKTLDNLPRSLDFGDVPLGLKKVKKFTLKPLNFDTPYVITFAEPTQHLEVWPTRGILKPGCPPVVVTVTYVPMAPVTLATSIWLRLPTVMYGPVAIRVTGRGCTQGTCRKVKKRQAKAPPKETNPTVVRSFKRWKQPGWASKMSAKRPRTTWSKAACTRKILMKSLKDRQHTEHELDGPLMANSQEAARRKTVFGQKMESWGRSLEDEAVLTEREERRFFEGVEIVHTLNRLAFSHMRDKLRELEEPLLASARLARESEWTEYLKRYLVPTYKPNDHQPLYVRQRIVRRADTVEPMKTSRSAVPLSCSAYMQRTTSTTGQNSELAFHPHARHHRLKFPSRHKVKFSERKLSSSFPGRSLPDLRGGGGSIDSGADEDSTDSLIDESEAYLRRSIDSIVTDGADEPIFVKRGRRPRSYSQPDHVFTNGCGPSRKAQPFIARVPSDLKADTWVKVIANDGRLVVGRVRYVGPLPGLNDVQVGIVLAPGEGGNSSGTYAGIKYFDCDADCGLFAPFKKVVMAWSTP